MGQKHARETTLLKYLLGLSVDWKSTFTKNAWNYLEIISEDQFHGVFGMSLKWKRQKLLKVFKMILLLLPYYYAIIIAIVLSYVLALYSLHMCTRLVHH